MQVQPLQTGGLSLCMIVKNEAPHLARCLASVQGVVDEMIVVDTGSTDRTVEIAEACQARVFYHPWQNDFAEARNFSLEQACGEWILQLDADEELETETRARLRLWLAQTAAEALLMTQRSFTAEGDLVRYDDLRITRLFRNRPEYRFEQAIHEQIRPSIERRGGAVLSSDLIIWHYGYAQPTAQGQQSRARRNLELLELALVDAPEDAYLNYQVGVTYKSLGHNDRAEAYLCRALELDQRTLGEEIRDVTCMKLSQIAYSRKDYAKASQYALASLEINPGNTISLYISGLSSIVSGDIKHAYTCFSCIRKQSDLTEDSLKDVETVLENIKQAM